MPTRVSRRRLLAAVGGVAATGAFGYAGARVAAREGTVVARYASGERLDGGTLVDQTEIIAEKDPGEGTDRRVHEDYRDAVPDEPPLTVSRSLHRRLEEEFDEVTYHLAHNCPDAACSTPRVTRTDFNGAELGSEVRLLYRDHPWATAVP